MNSGRGGRGGKGGGARRGGGQTVPQVTTANLSEAHAILALLAVMTESHVGLKLEEPYMKLPQLRDKVFPMKGLSKQLTYGCVIGAEDNEEVNGQTHL